METLSIYYIATDSYKEGFIHFQKNLHKFCPEFKKTVILLSDGLEEWDNKEENGITYKRYYIQHEEWPLITLYKMKHILDHWNESDYSCYFNADLQCNPDYDFNKQPFNLTKFNASLHVYDRENSPVVIIHNKKVYRYVQAGFFLGPANIVKKMCEDVCKDLENDRKNKVIKGPFHDESYLNLWVFENEDLVCRGHFMNHAVFDEDYPTTIINTIEKAKLKTKEEDY